MLPNPLHPAVVHFPIVLAVLLPISAAFALYAIRRGARPLVAWGILVALAGALSVASFVALKTGEAEEERVEQVVSEQVLHAHEEAAEQFLVASIVLLLVAAVGLARGAAGSAARALSTVGALGMLLLAVRVGEAGGQLVYQHGAASAYTAASGTPAGAAESGTDSDDD